MRWGCSTPAPDFIQEFVTDEIVEIIEAETLAAAAPSAAAPTRQSKVNNLVERARRAASIDAPFDEAWHTELAGRCVDRCDRPDGTPVSPPP